MGTVDLQALADMPGFGAAQSILRKEKLWDEYRGMPVKKYSVRVDYEIREDVTDTVIVEARCEEEAIQRACDRIENDCDYDINITDTEVME